MISYKGLLIRSPCRFEKSRDPVLTQKHRSQKSGSWGPAKDVGGHAKSRLSFP